MSDSAPDPFPLTEAELVGNYVETLCYGIYLVTCTFCARTLLFTTGPDERLRKPHEIRWFMVVVGLILFAVCTFDDVMGYVRNDIAFTKYDGADGPAGYLGNVHNAGSVARSVVTIFGMLVADFVLVYRCFIVYGRRWLVVSLSIVLYLAAIAMGIRVIHIQVTISNGHVTLNSAEIKAFATSFFAITAVQNIITTGLLIWRIWRVEHQNDMFRASRTKTASFNSTDSHRLRQVIRIIAESGATYTSFVIATFAVATANNNALYPLSDITLIAAGIMFNVIIVRSSPRREEQFTTFEANQHALTEQGSGSRFAFRGNSTKSDTINGSNSLNTFSLQGAMKSSDKMEDLGHGEAYRMRDVKVNVSTVSARD